MGAILDHGLGAISDPSPHRQPDEADGEEGGGVEARRLVGHRAAQRIGAKWRWTAPPDAEEPSQVDAKKIEYGEQ